MNRFKIFAGNWKMNLSPNEAVGYFSYFSSNRSSHNTPKALPFSSHSVIFVPAYCLGAEVFRVAEKAGFRLGAQNIHWEDKGAFTGELSGVVLKELGIQWTLLAHSERRQFFGETNESAAKRLSQALRLHYNTVFCVGESLEQREKGQTVDILKNQLKPVWEQLKPYPKLNQGGEKVFALAYEPVWAIGTGKTATPEQAEKAHQTIRELASTHLGQAFAEKLPILYGGSVNPTNTPSLLELPNVDGVLVGGASLKPQDFDQILSAGLA